MPGNSTFLPTAFNTQKPNDGGLPSADQGIALAIGSTTPTVYLSNVADGDCGVFYSPNDPATPSYCTNSTNASNTNGAVEVTITNTTLPSLPAATAPGTTNSYGFIRFRAKVK